MTIFRSDQSQTARIESKGDATDETLAAVRGQDSAPGGRPLGEEAIPRNHTPRSTLANLGGISEAEAEIRREKANRTADSPSK